MREAYNRIYAEALPIARSGVKEDFDIFFDSILEALREVERVFNYAKENNKPDLVQLSVEYDDALNDFNASIQVKFDVTEQVNGEKLLPDVVLDED